MRKRKVGPPRRPAAHIYTIPELDALQHQLNLRGLTGIIRTEQVAMEGIGHPRRPSQMLCWYDEKLRPWVAYAQ